MSRQSELIIYWKQLGDLLLMEPALTKLTLNGNSDVFVSTRAEFNPLLSLINNVYLANTFDFRNFSHIYSFDPRFRSCIKAKMSRSINKNLILSDFKHLKSWHYFFYNKTAIINSDKTYRAKYFFDAINVKSNMLFRPPKLNTPPLHWRPDYLPNNYILLHLTSAWKSKSWSPESWSNVINYLAKEGIGPFVITGGKASWENEYVKSIEYFVNTKIINLCGLTKMKEYLSIIANAKMVLAIDGSASHLASAFNRPVLTLFGPSHPLHWHQPNFISRLIDARDYSSERKPSLNVIPEEVVIGKAMQLWEEIIES